MRAMIFQKYYCQNQDTPDDRINRMNKLFLTLLFLALTAYAQMQERIAIINTMDDYDSLSVSALTYLTDRLRETAVNVLPNDRFGVMTTESIVAFLGSMENTVRVCKESSCLAELGRKVSADYVAQGRIGRFGRDLTIKVELYSVISGNLIGSFTGDSKDIYGLRDIINEKATDLFKKMLATAPPPTPSPQPPQQQEPQQVQYQPPQHQGANMEPRAKIQWYINKGLEKHKGDIRKEASSLSYIDKIDMYDKNKKGFLGYALLNTAPSFGLGSYIQGDISSGIKLSIADVVGVGIWSIALEYPLFNEDLYYDERVTLMISSMVVLAASRVMGWIYT